ncbi:jg10007 [Pararge aegeria aegeria]|uniref:Jg10007 protein n=3 Tax=Pararge aegeria TaxID=116150 RepID=A0A8S4SIE0_9NEOP|nr:jg10007 [Pararge aegeria aegeria]
MQTATLHSEIESGHDTILITFQLQSTMSHTVTITRTTTTTSGNTLFINTGYLGTFPGLLKLAQLLLGAACVGVVGYYLEPGYTRYNGQKPELFYLLVSVAFLIGTFCLLLSCLISLSTSTMISKTIYEVIYHGIAFVMYLAAGLTLMIEVNHQKSSYRGDFEPYLAAAVMGLVMAVLYLLSTFLANRSYRGI